MPVELAPSAGQAPPVVEVNSVYMYSGWASGIFDAALRIVAEGSVWGADANFAVFETLAGAQTVCFATGLYRDKIVREADGALRFQERTAISDSALIRNSLVIPL